MAATSLISRPPGAWIGRPNATRLNALLVFDATIKETHRGRNTITRQPVEQGVDITDHVRPEPDELMLETLTTNSPITIDDIAAADSTYAQETYQQLLQLKNDATFLTVSTGIRDYQNMIISSLDVDRDKLTGQVLSAKIGFQSVLVVSSQTVPAPAKPAGATKKHAGAKPAVAASGSTQSSVLSSLTGIGAPP